MPSGPEADEPFAKLSEMMGLASQAQIAAVKKEQLQASSAGQHVSLADIMVQKGVITSVQRENAEKKMRDQCLGPYLLTKKLGEGGMGAVYLAEDTTVGRKVAVKVLPATHANKPGFLSRFKREARAAGKLNHPNIVGAYNVGEDHGRHYYVMEYCEGESLEQRIKQERFLPWDRAMDLAAQIAQGLAFAHKNGFIHRDIKPANIFITRDSFAKILDFGLTKNVSENADLSYMTQEGIALGTPHYISPEQAMGEKETDGRTDIYSLGATLYHALTGQTPFAASTAMKVMVQHLSKQIPNPRDIRSDIPESVVQVLMRMMAKRVDDRYPNCETLIQDIEDVLQGRLPSSGAIDPALTSVAAPASKMSPGQTSFSTTSPTMSLPGVGINTNAGTIMMREPKSKSRAVYMAAGGFAAMLCLVVLALVLGKKSADSANASNTTNTSTKPVETTTAPVAVSNPPPVETKPDPVRDPLDPEAKGAKEFDRLFDGLKPDDVVSKINRLENFLSAHGNKRVGGIAKRMLEDLKRRQAENEGKAPITNARILLSDRFDDGIPENATGRPRFWTLQSYKNADGGIVERNGHVELTVKSSLNNDFSVAAMVSPLLTEANFFERPVTLLVTGLSQQGDSIGAFSLYAKPVSAIGGFTTPTAIGVSVAGKVVAVGHKVKQPEMSPTFANKGIQQQAMPGMINSLRLTLDREGYVLQIAYTGGMQTLRAKWTDQGNLALTPEVWGSNGISVQLDCTFRNTDGKPHSYSTSLDMMGIEVGEKYPE